MSGDLVGTPKKYSLLNEQEALFPLCSALFSLFKFLFPTAEHLPAPVALKV